MRTDKGIVVYPSGKVLLLYDLMIIYFSKNFGSTNDVFN